MSSQENPPNGVESSNSNIPGQQQQQQQSPVAATPLQTLNIGGQTYVVLQQPGGQTAPQLVPVQQVSAAAAAPPPPSAAAPMMFHHQHHQHQQHHHAAPVMVMPGGGQHHQHQQQQQQHQPPYVMLAQPQQVPMVAGYHQHHHAGVFQPSMVPVMPPQYSQHHHHHHHPSAVPGFFPQQHHHQHHHHHQQQYSYGGGRGRGGRGSGSGSSNSSRSSSGNSFGAGGELPQNPHASQARRLAAANLPVVQPRLEGKPVACRHQDVLAKGVVAYGAPALAQSAEALRRPETELFEAEVFLPIPKVNRDGTRWQEPTPEGSSPESGVKTAESSGSAFTSVAGGSQDEEDASGSSSSPVLRDSKNDDGSGGGDAIDKKMGAAQILDDDDEKEKAPQPPPSGSTDETGGKAVESTSISSSVLMTKSPPSPAPPLYRVHYDHRPPIYGSIIAGKLRSRPPDIKLGGICGDAPPNVIANMVSFLSGVRVVAVDMFLPHLARCALWLEPLSVEAKEQVKTVLDGKVWMGPMDEQVCYFIQNEAQEQFMLAFTEKLKSSQPNRVVRFPRHLMTVGDWE